jgi:hypothetical protein
MQMRAFRQRASRLVVAAMLTALPYGCSDVKDDLLSAPDPDTIEPASVNSPEAAEALRIGVVGRLRQITGGAPTTNTNGTNGDSPWMFSGLLTDEWKSGDTFLQRNETDQRSVQENNANMVNVYREYHRARNTATEAIAALQKYKPLPAWGIAQMFFVKGFAELELAETYCNGQPLSSAATGVPEYGPPLTNQQIFTLALAHFDSALTFATETAADAVTIKNAILIAKGRTLINLARFADAATAVTGVATNFKLLAEFSLTAQNNQIWALNTSAKRWTVGDSFDTSGLIANAIPFASAKDPRVPLTGTTTGTSSVGKSFDTATNFVRFDLYGRTDPVVIVSGLDARLMEAEALLNGASPNIAGAMKILNDLRAAPPNLGPSTAIATPAAMPALAIPATRDAAVSLFFREKAFWTFSRGQRLGDLRRLIRQYGRPVNQVFPTGTFFKGGAYGNDVNFPVHVDEQNNPDFKGCADRNA